MGIDIKSHSMSCFIPVAIGFINSNVAVLERKRRLLKGICSLSSKVTDIPSRVARAKNSFIPGCSMQEAYVDTSWHSHGAALEEPSTHVWHLRLPPSKEGYMSFASLYQVYFGISLF